MGRPDVGRPDMGRLEEGRTEEGRAEEGRTEEGEWTEGDGEQNMSRPSVLSMGASAFWCRGLTLWLHPSQGLYRQVKVQ